MDLIDARREGNIEVSNSSRSELPRPNSECLADGGLLFSVRDGQIVCTSLPAVKLAFAPLSEARKSRLAALQQQLQTQQSKGRIRRVLDRLSALFA